MEVRIGIPWEIVVDGEINTFNINTSTENIGGNTDSLLEILEGLISLDTILLSAQLG
jgi:hypothetical protein